MLENNSDDCPQSAKKERYTVQFKKKKKKLKKDACICGQIMLVLKI